MKTAKDVLKSIKDNDVKYVDLRFTDPRGKWQHVTFDAGMIEEDSFSEGLMFDGSSIAGWKAINESDMCLMPDPVSATIDPFQRAWIPAPAKKPRTRAQRRPWRASHHPSSTSPEASGWTATPITRSRAISGQGPPNTAPLPTGPALRW